MSKKTSYQQLKQISKAALLEESTHLNYIMYAIIGVTIVIIALVIWAAFATIEETAVTYGVLVPLGQVQVVQHLEGGIVTDVLINNGDFVKKGQTLVKLSKTSKLAELQTLRSKEVALILNSERLRAFLNNKPADVAGWSQKIVNSKYNTVKNIVEINTLLDDEKSLLESQYKKKGDQESIVKATIERRKEKLQETIKQKEVWERHIELLSKEFEMYNKLRKGNLISHKDYLVVLREMNRAKGELVRLISLIQQTQQGITESENQLKELDSDIHEKSLQELGTISDNLLEVRHRIERLDSQLQRLNVRAPVQGTVKGLRVYAGNVIAPGGLILEIVPFGRELVVESRVNPRDVGHIKVGDPVSVKVLTYDFARYGSIDGVLKHISASTFTDEQGKPFYKATIILKKQFIGAGKLKKQLLPGMTVEADVIVGEKTLLQYLLRPIHKSASQAFHER